MNSTCNRFIFSVNTNTYSKIWGKQSSVTLIDSSLCPMTFTMFHLLGIYHIQHIIYSIYTTDDNTYIYLYISLECKLKRTNANRHLAFQTTPSISKGNCLKAEKECENLLCSVLQVNGKKNPPAISTFTHASSFRSNKLLTIVKFPLWFYYLFYYIIFFVIISCVSFLFIYLFSLPELSLLLFIKWDFFIDYAWRIVNVLVIMASPI